MLKILCIQNFLKSVIICLHYAAMFIHLKICLKSITTSLSIKVDQSALCDMTKDSRYIYLQITILCIVLKIIPA